MLRTLTAKSHIREMMAFCVDAINDINPSSLHFIRILLAKGVPR